MSCGHFNDRREVVCLMTPHRAHESDFIYHPSYVGKPVRDRDPRLPIAREGPSARNDRAFHFGQVIAKADRIHHRASQLVIFWIKSIDVADPAAHEQKDDRPCPGRKMGKQPRIVDLAVFGPERAHGGADEADGGLKQEPSPRDSSAGINGVLIHNP